MSGKTKQITLSVRLTVSVTVDAEERGGEVHVVRTVRINGLPSAPDVMEALDADDELAQLDEEYQNAPAKG